MVARNKTGTGQFADAAFCGRAFRRHGVSLTRRLSASPTRRGASPHGVSPTQRFTDAALRRRGASPHGVSQTAFRRMAFC